MSLRPDRLVLETDSFHSFSTVTNKGVGLCYNVTGSGVALGTYQGTLQLAANPSGLRFAGILLQDFVNVDETRFHINWNREQQEVGDNADVAVKGWLVTNNVTGAPTEGSKAYLTANGVFTPTVSSTGGVIATPLAGEFGSEIDEAGYAKIKINLPNGN